MDKIYNASSQKDFEQLLCVLHAAVTVWYHPRYFVELIVFVTSWRREVQDNQYMEDSNCFSVPVCLPLDLLLW